MWINYAIFNEKRGKKFCYSRYLSHCSCTVLNLIKLKFRYRQKFLVFSIWLSFLGKIFCMGLWQSQILARQCTSRGCSLFLVFIFNSLCPELGTEKPYLTSKSLICNYWNNIPAHGSQTSNSDFPKSLDHSRSISTVACSRKVPWLLKQMYLTSPFIQFYLTLACGAFQTRPFIFLCFSNCKLLEVRVYVLFVLISSIPLRL